MIKKLLLIVSITTAMNYAFAEDSKPMHADAGKISRILLSTQLKECVAEFQRDYVTVNNVIEKSTSEGTTYQIEGVIIEGEDVAVGRSTLVINETDQPATFGFGRVTVYACKVERKLFH